MRRPEKSDPRHFRWHSKQSDLFVLRAAIPLQQPLRETSEQDLKIKKLRKSHFPEIRQRSSSTADTTLRTSDQRLTKVLTSSFLAGSDERIVGVDRGRPEAPPWITLDSLDALDYDIDIEQPASDLSGAKQF
jgi:hypothetical protein